MKIFVHSGHLGDLLYSLPAVKILSGDEGAIMYVKEVFEDHRGHINGNCGIEDEKYNQVDALKDLLLLQPFTKEVRAFKWDEGRDYEPGVWPHLVLHYDLDRSRKERGRGYVFHVKRYLDTFGITNRECNYRKQSYLEWLSEELPKYIPWLEIDNEKPIKENFAIFHVTYHTRKDCEMTERWNGDSVDWMAKVSEAKRKFDKVYFTGLKKDYEKFSKKYNIEIQWMPTDTLLDLARVVRDAQAVYVNQNCCLVLAQGLGKKYYLARNADRTHCHTGLETENLI